MSVSIFLQNTRYDPNVPIYPMFPETNQNPFLGSVYGGSIRDRDSVYGGGGGRDSSFGQRAGDSISRTGVEPRDPSIVEIPSNEPIMTSSTHSQGGSRYDTLAPNRDDL
ncbi:unnamed protein product [Caenorhabditis nigoni]|uniref:Uncharacterized protein n=1 Tax=Caenorhabditis nigoni TaxID=1611254 RepID=A0A2G5STJ8_9PELO|nr:hypothetical protein B9Z55_024216 [Caenorhabditis nigoni]